MSYKRSFTSRTPSGSFDSDTCSCDSTTATIVSSKAPNSASCWERGYSFKSTSPVKVTKPNKKGVFHSLEAVLAIMSAASVQENPKPKPSSYAGAIKGHINEETSIEGSVSTDKSVSTLDCDSISSHEGIGISQDELDLDSESDFQTKHYKKKATVVYSHARSDKLFQLAQKAYASICPKGELQKMWREAYLNRFLSNNPHVNGFITEDLILEYSGIKKQSAVFGKSTHSIILIKLDFHKISLEMCIEIMTMLMEYYQSQRVCFEFVVGKGLHSKGQKAVLRPKMSPHLKKIGYHIAQADAGSIFVENKERLEPKMLQYLNEIRYHATYLNNKVISIDF